MFVALFTLITQITCLLAQPETVPLHYGDIVHGQVTQNQADFRYHFEARAGDVVLIDMLIPINTRLDPFLQLTDPNGDMLAAYDERGTSAHLGPLTLPKDGQYEIRASAYVGTGPFTLQLTNTEEIAPIAFDKPLEITLDGEIPLVYLRFDNADSDMLRLEARQIEPDGPGTRPTMRVLDLSGARISDGGYNRDAGIDPLPVIPQTAYIIALQLNIPQESGARRYAVSIAPSDVLPLSPGQAVTGALPDVQFFEAKAEQRLRVRLTLMDEGIAPTMSIRSVDGAHFLIYANAASLEEFAATLNIPASALYVIEITDGSFSGAAGAYRLRIDGVD